MTAHTPDALASALPAGISYDVGDHFAMWDTREIAAFQAERLAQAGYVLVHTAPDEATVERLARALYAHGDDLSLDDEIADRYRQQARTVLAALADTPAQARHTADDATRGGAR